VNERIDGVFAGEGRARQRQVDPWRYEPRASREPLVTVTQPIDQRDREPATRSTQGLERFGTLVSILGLMRLTAEVRWFWPDRPPQEFHAWFVGAGAAWGRPARAKHLSTSTFAIRTKIPWHQEAWRRRRRDQLISR
jgi:hypothetical protein